MSQALVSLPESRNGTLHVLHIDSKPAARSYDGHPWEKTQGGERLDLACDAAGTCVATIATSRNYSITLHEPQLMNELQRASRFLVQATFGPTLATLQNVKTPARITKWIDDQMELSPTLHRQYYRRRVNPRFTASSGAQVAATGGSRAPCEASSRWHRMAFNRADEGKQLEVKKRGVQPDRAAFLSIDGELRTEGATDLFEFNNMYICAVDERVGGAILLHENAKNCYKKFFDALIMENPPITFSSTDSEQTRILSASEWDGGVLTGLKKVTNASMLTVNIPCTPKLQSASQLFLRGPREGIWSTTYWRHDPRLQLLANTLKQPFNNSVSGGAPPTVAKTFLNEDTCVPLELSSRTSYTNAMFQLDKDVLRNFYNQDDQRLVYYVDGLRLHPTSASACKGVSRWRRRNGACDTESEVDAATKEKIVAAIEGSKALILDLELECNSANTIGIAAKVTVDDACWEHSHPHQLNVYDFTAWAEIHPGKKPAITQFAKNGTVKLLLPKFHTCEECTSFWPENYKKLTYLGRFGDEVDFKHLHPSLQSAPIAELVGSEPVYSNGFEACGSPGEVANAPTEANRYGIMLTEHKKTRPTDSYPMDVPTLATKEKHAHSFNRARTAGGWGSNTAEKERKQFARGIDDSEQGKNIAWTNVVTNAPDQLRQRVAWALSQIFVVAPSGSERLQSERYHAYYDIFVRHAFGSFRDVMREVCRPQRLSFDTDPNPHPHPHPTLTPTQSLNPIGVVLAGDGEVSLLRSEHGSRGRRLVPRRELQQGDDAALQHWALHAQPRRHADPRRR